MAVDVKRKGNESIEGLLRRFREKVRRSRLLVQAKKTRFREKKKSLRQIKQEALVRKRNQEKREYLMKIGKIVEPVHNNYKKR